MNRNNLTKMLSTSLSLALLATSVPMPAGAVGAAITPMGEFMKSVTPSPSLGYVTGSYQGSTDHPVILIQDLHANYGVQKKIEGILTQLQPVVAQGGRPMVIGMEGAWGDVDLTYVRNYDLKVRRPAEDFLLKEAEVSAMTHFASLSEKPVKVVGVENPEDYYLNTNLFRKSLMIRLELAGRAERLHQAVEYSKAKAPASLKRIFTAERYFRSGKYDLDQLSKKIGAGTIENYGQAEAVLMERKLAVVAQEKDSARAAFMRNTVIADQSLSVLSRLLRQQMTLEEVQYAAQHLASMLVVVQSMLPGENMTAWKEAIQSAIDFYAVALTRNKPMAERAQELVRTNPDTSVVIVTGGFHTDGITETLRAKKISYVVLAPLVESHTAHDEAMYIKRMMGFHVSNDMIRDAAVESAGHIAKADASRDQNVAGASGESAVTKDTLEATREAQATGNAPTVASIPRDAMASDVTGPVVESKVDDLAGELTPKPLSPIESAKSKVMESVGLTPNTEVSLPAAPEAAKTSPSAAKPAESVGSKDVASNLGDGVDLAQKPGEKKYKGLDPKKQGEKGSGGDMFKDILSGMSKLTSKIKGFKGKGKDAQASQVADARKEVFNLQA